MNTPEQQMHLQHLDESKSLSDSYKIEVINSKTGEVLTEKEYLKLMNKKKPFVLGSYKQKRKVK